MRWIIAAFYCMAGLAHLLVPEKLEAITPAWVPFAPTVIFVAGVCEKVLADFTYLAIKQARAMEITTIGLLGNSGGQAAELVDLALIVPHHATPRIQEVHIAVSHIICQLVEEQYFEIND